jgi:hypothetical protein
VAQNDFGAIAPPRFSQTLGNNKGGRMLRPLFTALLLVMPVMALGQEMLCRPAAPVKPGVDDLSMNEAEFTFEKAEESVAFLRDDFSERLWGPEPVKDFKASSDHYISYMNSLRFIEGALLREHVLMLKAQASLLESSAPKSAETAKAQAIYSDALYDFCHFVKSAEYVD